MTVVVLDGIRIQVQPADLDNDGVTGGVENVPMKIADNRQDIIQGTETGEALKELNNDDINATSRMSGIDLRTRLHHSEVTHVLAADSLVGFGVLPSRCLGFTRQKKRLAVSIDGGGRRDIVDVVAGKRDMDAKLAGGGFMDKAKGFFGMGGK